MREKPKYTYVMYGMWFAYHKTVCKVYAVDEVNMTMHIGHSDYPDHNIDAPFANIWKMEYEETAGATIGNRNDYVMAIVEICDILSPDNGAVDWQDTRLAVAWNAAARHDVIQFLRRPGYDNGVIVPMTRGELNAILFPQGPINV